MTRSGRVLALVLAASAVPLALPRSVGVAHAAPDPAVERAKALFERGQKLFDVGRFADALKAYQQAYQAYPAPEFLFNIAQCHRNLGNYEDAIFSYRKFLELRPDTPERAGVERAIEQLEEKKRERDAQKLIPKPPEPKPIVTATPIYKKWWFWTGIAVVAIGGGVGGYLLLKDDAPGLPDTSLGNIPLEP